MDNIKFNVSGREEAEFRKTLNLLFDLRNVTAISYYTIKNSTLYFFNPYEKPSEVSGLLPMPFKMNREALIDFAWNWYSSLEDKERKQDTRWNGDAMNVPAWRIYVDNWGHVLDRHDGKVAIEAGFGWLGK